ncbi:MULTISPECIES: sensor histidine kinase [unclassified Oceanobacter]|uniref:sensor histidine kinase n=2 Tax=Gammaproteobacteria TaxID=1236 RepID=UPI0026E46842|nr:MULTISPECIES: sensor histidine kinase [unclassified Oceanobacter]MDO6682763.1 sensor histidine kinase [Oceanobacter sp. 5_MG-2023]MDP2607580.1 sensor histidine kinase [Oceanobacter sp. 1_MG-2023]MDP2610848.1 sensor histidine kinase [Oceanobacter sp. 2_MG-2023]
MNVMTRILLMVNSAFALALLVSLATLLVQGRDDVLREQQAMKPVVEALIRSGQPQQILALVGSSLRHVRVAGTYTERPDEHSVPAWFEALFDHPGRGYQLALTDSHGQKVILMSDDRDEIEEVWHSSSWLFWLFCGCALVSNLAIYLGVRAGLRPLADVLAAFDQVQQGHLNARLGHYSLREANNLAWHFNAMTESLESARNENRYLTRTLMEIQEQERSALARELHDDLGQQLTGVRVHSCVLPFQLDKPAQLLETSECIQAGCDAINLGFRRIINNLYPVVLERLGLQSAVDELLRTTGQTTGLDCVLSGDTWPGWNEEDAAQIYRLVQEAVNNAVRHAAADEIRVSLTLDSQKTVTLQIQDNGNGATEAVAGFGMRSMAERARLLGGTLTVDFAAEGTKVSAHLPYPQDAEDKDPCPQDI